MVQFDPQPTNRPIAVFVDRILSMNGLYFTIFTSSVATISRSFIQFWWENERQIDKKWKLSKGQENNPKKLPQVERILKDFNFQCQFITIRFIFLRNLEQLEILHSIFEAGLKWSMSSEKAVIKFQRKNTFSSPSLRVTESITTMDIVWHTS